MNIRTRGIPTRIESARRVRVAGALRAIAVAVALLAPLPEAHAEGIEMPMELRGGLVYLDVTIDGSDETLSFILDTGAMMSAMDPAAADRIGLESVGNAQAMGAGSETHEISIYSAAVLSVGNETFENVMLAGVPLEPLTIHTGGSLDGVLGHNVLSRYAVEIDYANERVVFHDPATWKYEGSGNEVPIEFRHNLPFVFAGIEEESSEMHLKHEGMFVIDTGASAGLVINRRFAEENGLFALSEKLIEGPTGFGIGGTVTGRVGRLPELRIGAHALEAPVTYFSADTKGALAHPDMAGVIGAKVLSRFRAIVDYPGARLILEANDTIDDPFEYDALGAHFVLRDGRVEVFAVLPETPAEEAGLLPGDHLVAINGKTAADLGLEALEEMLLAPDLACTLEIVRDGEALRLETRTRRLI